MLGGITAGVLWVQIYGTIWPAKEKEEEGPSTDGCSVLGAIMPERPAEPSSGVVTLTEGTSPLFTR